MIYLDGSALCRFLPGVRHYEAFGGWARDHIDELVTTQLGFTELRQAAELYPRSAAERVAGIVDLVRAGVAVIRFSDDNVAISSHATSVLKPFAALHLGAAVAHDQVDTIVTYDPALANVARIYELAVESPGLPQGWYLEYQGPPEHWKPVALDAPYEPGAEFDVPEVAPRPDAYEIAMQDAEREAAAKAEREKEAAVDAPSGMASDADSPPSAAGEPEEISDLERALRDAEAAALADGASGDHELDDARIDDGDAPLEAGEPTSGGPARGPGAVVAPGSPTRTGTYTPRVEAWHEGDDEADRPILEPEGEVAPAAPDVTGEVANEADAGGIGATASAAGVGAADAAATAPGDGLPWSGRPDPTRGPPGRDPLPRVPQMPPPLPKPPLPQEPPTLEPPAPMAPVGIPNLPREERGVPPVVAPARDSIGAAVRRPMFETNPATDSRASRPPDPVPPVPPEESSPLTVPIKWNVELDEPEAYLPLRFASDAGRVLPSLPVSFAGGQGGLTLESAGAVSVPALEPTGPALGGALLDDVRLPIATPDAGAPASARDRKAAEKAAKKERERREKAARGAKGASAPAPAPAAPSAPPPVAPSAPPPVAPSAPPPVAPSAPPPVAPSPAVPQAPAPAPSAGAEAWKLDDIMKFGPKKKGS